MIEASAPNKTNEVIEASETEVARRPRRAGQHHQEESIKETIESIVIALILAFVFRAYVVEAFVIPTGSMAPTLLGRHVRLACEQCGYEFDVDPEESDTVTRTNDGRLITGQLSRDPEAVCPMCHNLIVTRPMTRVSAGDRILVHKYIYSFSEPQRWDVVVFKNPQEPYVNYIKRLVGLPGEEIWIVEGNLYVRSSPNEPFEIARKTTREQVQREVWQPIYHSRYLPLDHADRTTGQYGWDLPWEAVRGNWQLEGMRSYVCEDQAGGEIAFNFNKAKPPYGHWYEYNQLKNRGYMNPEPIEDVRIAATFVPDAEGLSVRMETTARLGMDGLNGGVLPLRGAIDASGKASLSTVDPSDRSKQVVLAETQIGAFEAGSARGVELWYVDQEASLWVDDEKVLTWAYDLPFKAIRARKRTSMTPEIRIEVSGSVVTMHEVEVDRDLFYSDHNRDQAARGAALPRHGLAATPMKLGPDHFFCLGDNSPLSLDGRYWDKPNGWIEHRYLSDWIDAGHDPGGLVPRDLMMGRAFFVYFPAPYGLDGRSKAFIPNFGDMRFIR